MWLIRRLQILHVVLILQKSAKSAREVGDTGAAKVNTKQQKQQSKRSASLVHLSDQEEVTAFVI